MIGSYGCFRVKFLPEKFEVSEIKLIFVAENENAAEMAILAITVAKSPFFLPYDDGYSVICNGQK